MIVLQNEVKEVVKSMGMHTGGDFLDALDKKVEELIKAACERTKANGKLTIRLTDL